MGEITPAQLAAWLDDSRREKPVLLDVREPWEYDKARIAGSVLIPMRELPARQREVMDLRVNHGLSHAEIAALLEISEESSRANYYQALRRLRAAFHVETERT